MLSYLPRRWFVYRHHRVACLVTLCWLVLSGCTTNNRLPSIAPEKVQPVDISSLYLRGVFNWWEAEPAYRLTRGGNGSYSATIELIADGQPYDFKVADAVWTPANSCGARDTVRVLTVGDVAPMYCGVDAMNFQFTPQSTGKYTFSVTSTSAGVATLTVTAR